MNQPTSIGSSRSPLSVGEAWAPMPDIARAASVVEQIFCVDRAKYNLFWLAEPRLDTEGIAAARRNPIAESINNFMTADLRAQCVQLPSIFMKWWVAQNHRDMIMTSQWPVNYMETMRSRLGKAQANALSFKEEDNVVTINFRRRA